MSDMRAMSRDPTEGVSASPHDENLFLWSATIFGPQETPWEGGMFNMRLTFDDQVCPSSDPVVEPSSLQAFAPLPWWATFRVDAPCCVHALFAGG